MTAVLEEILGVEGDNPSLVGLGNISEHCVNHGNQHPVLMGVASVLDNWDNIRSSLCNIQKISKNKWDFMIYF